MSSARKTKGAIGSEALGLNALLDVPMKVVVEVGQARLPIEDVLKLRSGSVIALDRLSGEPLNIKVGGKLIARGECVVVDGKLGIRITEIAGDFQEQPEISLEEAG